MSGWPKGISVATLFVEDLAAAKRFYRDVFEVALVFEDENSAVFGFGNLMINLLATTAAPELVAPATVAGVGAGPRMVLTIGVEDVDALCEQFTARGVTLLNGPMDRPRGVRTASFADPGGHT
jgi:catechol 2,3-dioxygenase-like lactoylglutathione lyase family enzyme